MLDIIATLCKGQHPYFAKDYKAPKQQREYMPPDLVIDNNDGFFDGLPASKHGKR